MPNIPVTASMIARNEPARLRFFRTRSGSSGFGPFDCQKMKLGQQDPGQDQRNDHSRGSPAVRPGLTQPVDEGHQSTAAEHDAGDIEPDPGSTVLRRDQGEGAECHERGDGQIDVQAPAPIEVLGQESAQDQAEGRAADGDRGVDPERPGPLARVGERGAQEREHGRRQQRPEQALQSAGTDQHRRSTGPHPPGPRPGRNRRRRS